MFDRRPALAAVKGIRDSFKLHVFNGETLTSSQMIEPGWIDEVFDVASVVLGILK